MLSLISLLLDINDHSDAIVKLQSVESLLKESNLDKKEG